MNLSKEWLKQIFGDRMPKTATSFFTANGHACFEGGRIRGMKQVRLTETDINALKEKGLLGASGWSLK